MPEMTDVLKALADESRYKIVCALLEKGWCVGGLARELEMSKPAVSQHLQVLRKANLVTGEKEGYYTYYSVNRETLKGLGDHFHHLATQEQTHKCKGHGAGSGACRFKEKS